MSEQGTEKTNPLHGLEQDGTGTGTGVWAHPAAEPRQPEQQRCECGRCWWNGGAWVASPSESNRPVLYLLMPHWGVDFVAHCPGKCGCRLSVVDGEPRVGEKYADLERDAKRFRAVERAMGTPLDSPFNTHRWHYETDGMDTRYDTLGEYADALLGGETDGE